MTPPTEHRTVASATSRWPHQGPGQRRMLVAAILVLVGAVSPWVALPTGTILGIEGAGIWTIAAGGIGLAGALYRSRLVVRLHAVVLAATPLALGGWQVAHLLRLGCDLRVCSPSFGLVLTLGGGVLAASAVRELVAQPPRSAAAAH